MSSAQPAQPTQAVQAAQASPVVQALQNIAATPSNVVSRVSRTVSNINAVLEGEKESLPVSTPSGSKRQRVRRTNGASKPKAPTAVAKGIAAAAAATAPAAPAAPRAQAQAQVQPPVEGPASPMFEKICRARSAAFNTDWSYWFDRARVQCRPEDLTEYDMAILNEFMEQAKETFEKRLNVLQRVLALRRCECGAVAEYDVFPLCIMVCRSCVQRYPFQSVFRMV